MTAAKRLYAEGTQVSPERSQAEIVQILRRYGAEGFSFGEDHGYGMVAFRAHGRMVRFLLPLEVDRGQYRMTRGYQTRSKDAIDRLVEGEIKRRWRALAMAIKAKLEVVESGIATFQQEFLANLMLPNGETVGEFVEPQIEDAYTNNEMPALLPGAGPKMIER